MEKWLVDYLYDEIEHAHPRWGIMYKAPEKFGGAYSSSVPKEIVNSWVHLYGLDPSLEEDLEEMAEFVVYFGIVRAVHYSITRDAPLHPLLFAPDDARKGMRLAIDRLKLHGNGLEDRVGVLCRWKVPGVLESGFQSVVVGSTLKKFVTNDLRAHIDKDRIKELGESYEKSRSVVTRQKMWRAVAPEYMFRTEA